MASSVTSTPVVPSAEPTVEPTVAPTAEPTVVPTEAPTAAPTEDLYEDVAWEEVDLSTWTAFGMTDNCMLDTNTGIFNAKDQEFFGFQLSKDLTEGQEVVVRVKGTNNGEAGFRSWLVDAVTTTCTPTDSLYLYTSAANEEFAVGDFEITYTLPASADCSYLFFKGPAYGTNIEDLSITSIEIGYPKKWETIDLSTWTAFGMTDNCMLDTNTGIFNAKDQEFFGFQLSHDLAEGEYIDVRVKGTNNGEAGFRSWLVDAVTTTCTPTDDLYLYTSAANEAFTVGDFEITYRLPASAECSYLFFKGPAYGTNIEDLSFTSVEVSYSNVVEVVTFEPTEEDSAKMVADSLLSTGNNARIKNVIEKARAGEDVTLAYIGGSVTEGSGANPNSKCYAELSCTKFAEAYGTGENVHFVNAGMSGTPSSLGIVRYEQDVLGQMATATTPDILFIEFSVNDSGECTKGGAYEGLIRRALEAGSAVVLVFAVFRDNWNMQDTYIPYGEHYDLPMVSVKDAVSDYIDEADGFRKWYFADAYHPTTAGHELSANCIMNMFDAIDKEEADTDNITDLSAFATYKTDAFAGTTMMGPATIEALLAKENSSLVNFNAGGFSETDGATGTYLYDSSKEKFPENWMHTAESGSDSLTATVNCKNLLVVYKLSNSESTGTAELYVDGELKVTMNAYNRDGWNNATTVLAFSEEEAAEHTIEIKMAEGSEEKEFTLLALGYN